MRVHSMVPMYYSVLYVLVPPVEEAPCQCNQNNVSVLNKHHI